MSKGPKVLQQTEVPFLKSSHTVSHTPRPSEKTAVCTASKLCDGDSSANVKASAEGLGAGETLPGAGG